MAIQKDIARELGVSQVYVARALRGGRGISEEARARVLAAAEKVGYDVRANQAARTLAMRRHGSRPALGVIGCLGFINDPQAPVYWGRLLAGILRATRRSGNELLILEPKSHVSLERVDGLLFHLDLEDQKLPNVPDDVPAVGVSSGGSRYPLVAPDDRTGMRVLISYLASLGHRKFSYLGYIERGVGLQRFKWAEEALREYNLPWHPKQSRTVKMRGYSIREWARNTMTQWIAEGWSDLGCTAVLVQHDNLAIGVMDALTEAHIRVPKDVSVTGFDSTEECLSSSPPLTSVHVPLEEIGAGGFELLEKMIQGEQKTNANVLIPVSLDVRKSTGKART